MPLCGRRGTTLNNFSENRLDLSSALRSSRGFFLCVRFGKCLEVRSYATWTYRQPDGKAASKIVPPRLRSDAGRASVPIPKRSASPRATSTL